ncbi:PadR family transcriptional regulator [Candidatus Clostridium radicumherbarum]|uniref:PadR family transcriptional regulator n=1 Tax=Candidatus Clostridium radicumherbarum TaxID=3381662 RepID=A0ABW8TQU3_9CLOT
MKKTRYVLLGLLQEENLSGYELKKIIDIRMSFFWQESYGQIYPELSKMAEEGLVEISHREIEGDLKREKINYKITSKGTNEFKRWMEQENEKDTVRSEVLLKLYLSTSKNISEMQRHIIKFKEQSEEKLKLFNLFEAELKQVIDLHNNHKQILSVLDLGIRQAKLYIDWSEEILKNLESEE